MITITRLLARQLRAVFRRTLGNAGSVGPTLSFTAGPEGLSVRAKAFDAAVEYLTPGELPPEEIAVPFELLAACEGRDDRPVTIEALSKGHVAAGWRDGNVPQMVRYDAVPNADEFPALPKRFAQNPPVLLQALRDASDTTDLNSARYALGYVQLRGAAGTLAATDGKQLLVQSGFRFPWKDDLLLPAVKVFGSAELPQDKPVEIGKSDDWVTIRLGPWTIWLAVNKDGRFPETDREIPCPANVTARVCFDPADAEFLGKSLPKLPCDDEYNFPVTVDLNGSAAIRAKGEMQDRPTELVLARSILSGEPIRIHTNRKLLARALKLGFRELSIFGDKSPVLCRDEKRQYVWALLDPASAIAPADDAVRIVSSEAVPSVSTPTPKTRRRIQPVSEPTTNQNGPAPTNGRSKSNGQPKANGQPHKAVSRRAGREDISALIQQAETLRAAQRENLARTNELVKALKRYRRQGRIVANTLASLRQIKTLGV